MKKIIRYRISISKVFPAYHPKAGEPNDFKENLLVTKIHTIRGNYDLWKKRFEKINQGLAVLELYQWTGKPYKSKCETIITLSKDDGIGLEKLEFHKYKDGVYSLKWSLVQGVAEPSIYFLSQNDGLSFEDFKSWFGPYDLSKPLAIIHFTKFRYEQE